jgi:hypothetical protein
VWRRSCESSCSFAVRLSATGRSQWYPENWPQSLRAWWPPTIDLRRRGSELLSELGCLRWDPIILHGRTARRGAHHFGLEGGRELDRLRELDSARSRARVGAGEMLLGRTTGL